MEIARNAIPGTFPFQINVPGPKGAYQIRSRFPEDLTPGGRSRVIVDQYSGAVLFAEGSRTAPAGARIVIANRAIHTGDIFGIPSKFLMSLASLMAAASGDLRHRYVVETHPRPQAASPCQASQIALSLQWSYAFPSRSGADAPRIVSP